MAAITAVVVVLALLVVDVGLLVAHRIRIAGAADSAALAAAPVTFRAYGAAAGPREEAARFAAANGAALVECRCRIDRTLRSRTVSVVVAADIELLAFGLQRVSARSSATFTPASVTPLRAPPGAG